jgi:hypothetical protein
MSQSNGNAVCTITLRFGLLFVQYNRKAGFHIFTNNYRLLINVLQYSRFMGYRCDIGMLIDYIF